jgi:hypothetical protein
MGLFLHGRPPVFCVVLCVVFCATCFGELDGIQSQFYLYFPMFIILFLAKETERGANLWS